MRPRMGSETVRMPCWCRYAGEHHGRQTGEREGQRASRTDYASEACGGRLVIEGCWAQVRDVEGCADCAQCWRLPSSQLVCHCSLFVQVTDALALLAAATHTLCTNRDLLSHPQSGCWSRGDNIASAFGDVPGSPLLRVQQPRLIGQQEPQSRDGAVCHYHCCGKGCRPTCICREPCQAYG